MGYIRHNAIVVTSWQADAVGKAHAAAGEAGNFTTPIVASPLNGYSSFLVIPDGSKEGWEDSDKGDAARDRLVAWLRAAWRDHLYLDWCEVSYGGDESESTHVVRFNEDEDDG